MTTTIVLLAGFFVLSQSSFALNSYMARITTVIISAALIIDFILLPSLLILVSKDEEETSVTNNTVGTLKGVGSEVG